MRFSKRNFLISNGLCILGFLTSCYAVYVEENSRNNDQYVALCDISDHMSCSKIFTSEYGKVYSKLGLIQPGSYLDLPNTYYGVIFYVLMSMLLRYLSATESDMVFDILLALATLSVVTSAYLGYILFYVIKNICVVCFTTHLCNIGIFMCLFAAVLFESNEIPQSTLESSHGKVASTEAKVTKKNKRS